MKPHSLKQLVKGKRDWTEPLAPTETEKGFKGWYAPRNLPHFDAPGTRQFITYRLADAIPATRRHEWQFILKRENDSEKQRETQSYLDKGFGACHLRTPAIADLVQENLWHHDGVKYRPLAWVIMPNHVHVLVEIWDVPLGEVVKSWKSYTSKQALKILGAGNQPSRPWTFWEKDYFDQYLRDDEHYRRVVHYIENNPNKAMLVKSPRDWLWSSARYRGESGLVVPILTHPTAERKRQNQD